MRARTLQDLVDAARETTARHRARAGEREVRRAAEARAAAGSGAGEGGALRRALGGPGVAVIAEVKGASPLHGPLTDRFEPLRLAEAYAEGGAAALSVLTEERYFAGSIDLLERVAGETELPTLRKDFVVDPYQVWEAGAAGAAAVLLIAELLDGAALEELVDMARSVGLDALVEFHRPDLMDRAVDAGSGLVGVNNRDLDTMEVDGEHALRMVRELPDDVVRVAESGIVTPGDMERVREAGFDAALVGTVLVRSADPRATLEELRRAGGAGGDDE